MDLDGAKIIEIVMEAAPKASSEISIIN